MFGLPWRRMRRADVMGAGGGAAATLGLKTNLVAWWELDEASGNRADSHTNALTLTDVNTVTSNTGVGGVGTAAQFTAANTEELTRTSEVLLQPGAVSWGFCGFVYFDSLAVQRGIICKSDGGANREYEFFYRTTGTSLALNVGGTQHLALGNPGTGAWVFFFFGYNASDGKYYGRLNNNVMSSAAGAASVATAQVFRIGNRADGMFHNGRIAKVAYTKGYIWTEAEVSLFYNGGAGRTYAEL